MTIHSKHKINRRPMTNGAATHLYVIGQTVKPRRSLPMSVGHPAEIYHITAALPASGDVLQYRIRSDNENFDRVVTQDLVEPAVSRQSRSGSTLLTETFGHG